MTVPQSSSQRISTVYKKNIKILKDNSYNTLLILNIPSSSGNRHGGDHIVVGFTTTYTISAYHHWSCEFESCSWRDVLDTSVKVCQWLAAGQWFSPVSNKTDCHNITEILLKVALNIINLTPPSCSHHVHIQHYTCSNDYYEL